MSIQKIDLKRRGLIDIFSHIMCFDFLQFLEVAFLFVTGTCTLLFGSIDISLSTLSKQLNERSYSTAKTTQKIIQHI